MAHKAPPASNIVPAHPEDDPSLTSQLLRLLQNMAQQGASTGRTDLREGFVVVARTRGAITSIVMNAPSAVAKAAVARGWARWRPDRHLEITEEGRIKALCASLESAQPISAQPISARPRAASPFSGSPLGASPSSASPSSASPLDGARLDVSRKLSRFDNERKNLTFATSGEICERKNLDRVLLPPRREPAKITPNPAGLSSRERETNALR